MEDFDTEFANHLVIGDIIHDIKRIKATIAYLYSLAPGDEDYEFLTPEIEEAYDKLAQVCQSYQTFLYWYRNNKAGSAYQEALDKVARGENLTEEERALFKNRPLSRQPEA